MKPESRSSEPERHTQIDLIQRAAADAVREALRRHMLLGESVAVGDESGGVRIVGPDELRKLLQAA